MYGLNGQSSGDDHIRTIMENIDQDDDFCVEDETKTQQDDAALIESLGIEMEDVHGPTKVILQRQFFEAIVRAAFVKYRNCVDLPSLSDKLDHMFKTKLVPNAIKTKAKSSEEEKNFKLAEVVLEEYSTQLHSVFNYFGQQREANSLHRDATMTVSDLINMFRKAKILDCGRISTHDFIEVVERYLANGQGAKLSEKLQTFQAYAKANEANLLVNQEIAAIAEHNAQAEAHNERVRASEAEDKPAEMSLKPELPEEEVRKRTEEELSEMHAKWHARTVAEHIMLIKGAEIVFFEFKEILYNMAKQLKDLVEPKTGKMTVVLKKFIEEWLLRRLTSFVKFNIPAHAVRGKEAARQWPESEKDRLILDKLRQQAEEAEQQRQQELERERLEAEAREQAKDSEPEIDPAELEEMRRKQAEEEEQARIAREAAEEAALAGQESSGSDDDSDLSDADDDGNEDSF